MGYIIHGEERFNIKIPGHQHENSKETFPRNTLIHNGDSHYDNMENFCWCCCLSSFYKRHVFRKFIIFSEILQHKKTIPIQHPNKKQKKWSQYRTQEHLPTFGHLTPRGRQTEKVSSFPWHLVGMKATHSQGKNGIHQGHTQGCTKWRTRRTSPPQADFDGVKKWFQNQAEQTSSPARLINKWNKTYLIILNMNYNQYL